MTKKQKNNVGIEDLVVADFRTEHVIGHTVMEWRAKHHVPHAESCARQIWFADKDTFKSFPTDHIRGNAVIMHHGALAYKFLMQLNLGLLSQRQGETNITGQFYEGWQKLHTEHPEQAKRYDTLMQNLVSDNRLIRSSILSQWKMRSNELCARDLSGMKNRDTVLLVGDVGRHGDMSVMTDSLIRKIATNENMHAQEVLITHPDPKVVKQLLADAKDMKRNLKLAATFTATDFDEVPIMMALCDRTYVTLPMDANKDADKYMIRGWQEHAGEGSTLTHLKADPANMAKVSDTWLDAGLRNFVTPDDIKEEMVRRARLNDRLAHRAELAIDASVKLRMEGIKPTAKTMGGALNVPNIDMPEPDPSPDEPRPSCG